MDSPPPARRSAGCWPSNGSRFTEGPLRAPERLHEPRLVRPPSTGTRSIIDLNHVALDPTHQTALPMAPGGRRVSGSGRTRPGRSGSTDGGFPSGAPPVTVARIDAHSVVEYEMSPEPASRAEAGAHQDQRRHV